MALEDEIAGMNRNRVQRGMCLTVDDLAQQVQSHQSYVTNVVNDLVTQIEVIETGDGVKMVRGLATTEVTGSDFQIDTIVSLTDGFDAPTAPLDVTNVIGFSCPDNHVIYAILNPGSTEWEGITVPPKSIRMIFGRSTADVDYSASVTFTLNTIYSFTPGYTHPTSTQEVINLFEVDAPTGQRFLAIQYPENSTWYAFTDIVGDGGGGGGGTTVNLISATVNQVGGVARDDATFAFDAASALLGTIVGTTGTAQNSPADEWFDNETILLVQDESDNWIPIHKPEPEIVPVLVVDDIPAATIAGGEIAFGTTVDSISVLKLNSAGDAYEADVTAAGINITDKGIQATSSGPISAWAWKRREGYTLLEPIRTAMSAYALTTTVITAALGDTPGTGTVVLKVFDGSDYSSGDTYNAINPTEMQIDSGVRVPGQILSVDGDDYFEIAWSDYRQGIPGWTDGNNQSIGHDASGEMEWQDDGECE